METIIIGIAGGTGSGKTTLTERLRDHFGSDEVSVINHDSYYKRHDDLPYENGASSTTTTLIPLTPSCWLNICRPLRRGETVEVPVYNYAIHNRSDKTVTVCPAPVIIVEGIYDLCFPGTLRADGFEGIC